jgi:transcription-repair coupling factor (superfamily II helicase)
LNLQDLIDIYQTKDITPGIIAAVQKDTAPAIAINGLRGSIRALIGAAVFRGLGRSQLYILQDRESAEYFQNDLQTFLDQKTVWLYPSPFRNDTDFDALSQHAVLERTDLLNRLREHQRTSFIIVTYPEALPEKVLNPDALKANLFEVAVGDNLDMDFLIDFLVQYRFERTDFVYEPGTFSVRGGIVDVFSYANELPFRMELLGDEVESIRVFDPETQLSVRKMQRVTILPNMEGQEKNYSRTSFLNFLPPNTLIFAHDLYYSEEIINQVLEKVKDGVQVVHEEQITLEAGDFESFAEIEKGLSRFAVVEWGGRHKFQSGLTFEAEVIPQPEFNKNFNLLAENLAANTAKGIENIIFSDQPKQVERLYAIFEDMKAAVDFTPIYKVLHEGFIDRKNEIACFTEHQIFGRYQKYKGRKAYAKNEAITLKELYDLKPGDFVTHIDHGVGVFSGLEKIDINGKKQEAVRLKYKGGDLLYVNIHSLHKITRFVGQEGKAPKLNKLGTQTWETLKNKTKSRVKDIARDLIKLYAQRKAQKGFTFSRDNYMQTELEASFIYEDTPDQAKSTEDVKRDMEASFPMDRLVCGDVGFGKTEIAIRAAFKAVLDGKQVAVLVPTTVLASQHFKTFKNRLSEFPVTVDFISRFKNPGQQKETLRRLEEGKVDILIGTHRILSKDIKWKDLGLLIIDEEQKFGVAAKEKLRAMKTNVDTLTLTATPIPRTLQFSLMGARDMSIINTPPPNRQPVKTRIEVFDKDIIQEAIEYEVNRGGQVYFVHNRVKDIQEMGDMVRNLVPYAKVAVAHAQMEPEKLEEIMLNFIEGYYDVLVSTNIVESGLDIPNANTMIIDQAQNFGLSDLYQLRGRVGRSNRKAFCYLLTPPMSVVTSEARKRLAALEEHTELGSGFLIAMKDLDIRGAGNILGAEQSGFIAEIGYEMYQKILREAMSELKEEEFAELFAGSDALQSWETQIETDLELLIPDRYVSSVNERLALYNKINDLDNAEQLLAFETEMQDRFGPIPGPTKELLSVVRLKWQLRSLNIEKASLKRGRFKGHFSRRTRPEFFQGEDFGRIIEFVQRFPQRARLEQKGDELIWIIQPVHSVREALAEISKISRELA